MKLIKCIFVLFCFCVCFVCVSSMVAERVTVKVFDYILTPYNSFVRAMIGGQEQMGNVLPGLGLMFVGVFVYCAVLVIVMQLFMVLFKALLSLWRKHNSVNPVNSTSETQNRKEQPVKPFVRMILVTTLALAAGCASTLKVDNAPVAALDLSRYLGEWYEIARFDHSFERGVEQAKANYTQNADGTIKVVNSGIKDGKPKTAIGKGKKTDTPGLLRVSFFGPFYADYRVMLIDKDYTHALVGSGSADYLWILSRTPGLSETAKAELLAEARRRGYDTGEFIWVRQDSMSGVK